MSKKFYLLVKVKSKCQTSQLLGQELPLTAKGLQVAH